MEMLTWSLKRKFLIISIIVLVLGLIAWGAYAALLKRPPTCFDGKENGNELGVDCGGSCARFCEEEIKNPIMRSDPRVFEVSPGNYSVLIYFENSNVNAEVKQAPYSIRLNTKSGALLEERKGVVSIPKHSRFAILETGFMTPSSDVGRADFAWDGNLSWIRNEVPSPDVFVTNSRLSNENIRPRVDATVSNKSLLDIPALEFIAVVSDGAGNAVGASKTVVRDLLREDVVPITFTWPRAFSTTESICISPVDTVLLIDRSGSMEKVLGDVKKAAGEFLAALRLEDRAAVVSFANTASDPADFSLSGDRSAAAQSVLNISIASTSVQNTNVADALIRARTILGTARNEFGGSDRKQVVVLLTDGVPTLPTKPRVTGYPEIAAQDEAEKLKNQGVTVFTIGLGKDIDEVFMKSISASSTAYYAAPSADTLENIYRSIATNLCVQKPAEIDIIFRIVEVNTI